VAWGNAAVSLARATAALALADGSPALLVASEQTGRLLLRSDPGLAEELATQRLAPLAELSPRQRVRMTDTLRAWLAEQGRLTPVAARLGVHPQTVRYRLARLRELFGDALDDPDQRFWLELALRAGDG
jgi:DNA-binding PucR family transcriptional regulator